jgi:hypothetical protein
VDPYVTLDSLACAGLFGLDIGVQKGKNSRMVAAGLDRLVLRDEERQAHCDGAAFLGGERAVVVPITPTVFVVSAHNSFLLPHKRLLILILIYIFLY